MSSNYDSLTFSSLVKTIYVKAFSFIINSYYTIIKYKIVVKQEVQYW